MSELPKGWVESAIGEACLIENGLRKPISLKERANCQGDFPYYGATGVIDHLNSYTHEGEYVLIGEDGANLLSKSKPLAFIANGKYWVNNHAHTLRCLADSPNLYLEKYFNSLSLESWVTGSAQPKLTKKNLEGIPYPLAPLAEQKRIVEKLDEVLAQVDTIKARLDGIPNLLKRFRQSVLASAVSGKLTEEWRGDQGVYPTLNELKATIDKERFEIWCSAELNKKIAKRKAPANDEWKGKYQPANPKYYDPNKRTAIEGIKAPWLITSLDAVSILTTGKTPSTSKDEYWNGETMFVSPAQIHPEGYLHNPSRYVSEKGCQIVPLISKGSTLIVCIGTVGKVGLLTKDVVINQQINAITPLSSVVHKYMYYWCKTLYPWIIDTARATVNAAILNKSTMSTAPFALPSLEEQKEIVRLVDQYFAFADTIEAQVKKAQARVDNLTQSILAKAFRGELVAQDPNDEPADKLLERIAEARKEAEALAKAAKKAEVAKKKAAKSA